MQSVTAGRRAAAPAPEDDMQDQCMCSPSGLPLIGSAIPGAEG